MSVGGGISGVDENSYSSGGDGPLWSAFAGGVAALAAGGVQVVEVLVRMLSQQSQTRFDLLANLFGDVSVILVAAALLGLYRVVVNLRGEVSSVATAGMIVALLTILLSGLMVLYDLVWLASGPSMYGSVMTPPPQLIAQVGFLSLLCSLVLLGAAGFQAGALGRWRFYPLLLALIAVPVPSLLAFLLSSGAGAGVRTVGLPFLIPALGFILLGLLLMRNDSLDRAPKRRPK